MTTAQRIKDIEDEMSKTQKNKNTEYHLGQLKGKPSTPDLHLTL
jgi:ribosome-interacting GTPase 1